MSTNFSLNMNRRSLSLANGFRKMNSELASVVASTSFRGTRPASGSLCGANLNRCVIYPAQVNLVATSVEQRNQHWFVRANAESDLIVRLEDCSFHLHKLPIVSKSGYLNRLVFEAKSYHLRPTIRIDNFPGGTKTFEMVVKFCYGWKVQLTPNNVTPIYCAAHFLEMNDDLEHGNLILKAESFLTYLIFSSWRDTFRVLKSCESSLLSLWPKELQILKRCSEAIAWKATEPEITKDVAVPWWFEDVSSLQIDHFIEVIGSIKRKGLNPQIIGSCIAHWTSKWMERDQMTHYLGRVTLECLIKLLPDEEGSVSFNFLLHLLKIGLAMKIDPVLIADKVEKRAVMMLENCSAKDLLVTSHDSAVYDVHIVARVLKAYVVMLASRDSVSRLLVIGRLVDEFLTLLAREQTLQPESFLLLVQALPRNARFCSDNLYRAIDMYFKAHPNLTEEERNGICKGLEYYKLSQEARQHAVKNDRLPLNFVSRIILLEQVNMTKSITGAGSNYQRTKTQAIIRVNKKINMMKQDVERIKLQLDELQMHRMEIQRQMIRRAKLECV